MGILILVKSDSVTVPLLGTEHNDTDQFFWKDQIIGDHDKHGAGPSGRAV